MSYGFNCATMSPRCLQQQYANQIGFADGDSSLIGLSPVGGGVNSVYGAGFAGVGYGGGMPIGNYGMGMPGMGCGIGPGAEYGNMSQADAQKYQAQMQKEGLGYQADYQGANALYQEKAYQAQLASQIRMKHFTEGKEFEANAQEDVITSKIANTQRLVKNNDLGLALSEYSKIKAAVRAKFEEAGYKNVADEQINAYAQKLYAQTTGKNLLDDIQENGSSSFVNGLKKGLGFGFFTGNKSKDEAIAAITGEQESTSSKLGEACGAASILGITGALIVGACKMFRR